MIKRAVLVLGLIFASGALGNARQQPGAAKQNSTPWVVSVIHTVDVDKMVARLREQMGVRVGVPGSAPQFVYTVATGLIIDDKGHVVTRLVNLDPRVKDQKIMVTTAEGATINARLVGVDWASGFAVLEAPELKAMLPAFGDSNPPNGMSVNILSMDYVPGPQQTDRPNQVLISPSIKVLQGEVRTDSIYSKARGAFTIYSRGLLSRNDSSIVMTSKNELMGIAQYVSYGRAYLFPIRLIRDTIARRVIEKRDSVPAGWLGLKGDSLAKLPQTELAALGLTGTSGVIVREITPESPAASVGILPDDVIVSLDDLDVMGTADLVAMVSSSPAGRSVKLKAIRKREPLEISVVLGARPDAGSTLSLLAIEPQGDLSLSQREQIQARLNELYPQLKMYAKQPPSMQQKEVISELTIEIRQLQDNLRLIDQAEAERQRLMPGNVSNEPPSQNPLAELENPFVLGFVARDLTPQLALHFGARSGVWVTGVTKGSPAEVSGLAVGDVITQVQGRDLLNSAQLRAVFDARHGSIPLTVIRSKKVITISVVNQ
ncbi:MAG TPA: PDZ domain-containing protein [Blastocatellia bacterium]|jgi:S1-C subfamily serine protease|nr:PDZ domain-containing protein [Blastocatellia bacterium]